MALIGTEAWELMSSRALRRFERTPSGLAYDECEGELLASLGAAFGWKSDAPDVLDRLRERGLAVGDELTIAGALLLTKPSSSLSLNKAVVEVRRYPDEGTDYDRRLVFDGSLPDQIQNTTRFVVEELGRDLVVTGVYRHELPKLPEVVIREAIAYAVAHRTYENNRTAVLVELRPAEVVVSSPASLPEPVTVATIRQEQAARNPDIIDALRRLSLAEAPGRGVDVMQDQMEEALLDPPEFEDNGSMVTVRLPLRGPITPRERAWVGELERQGSITAQDRLLLVHAARGETLTNSMARSILSTDDTTAARRALQRLRDAGLLEQLGDRGGAMYTLAEAVAPPAVYRLTPRQLADLVLEAAQRAPLSNEAVREMTGLDRPQTLALLARLTREGQLRRTGTRRGTRYHLK